MRYLMVAIIALLVPAAAMANECKADKKKFCPEGLAKKDINRCLRQHMAELSAACKTYQEAERKAKAKKRTPRAQARTRIPQPATSRPRWRTLSLSQCALTRAARRNSRYLFSCRCTELVGTSASRNGL